MNAVTTMLRVLAIQRLGKARQDRHIRQDTTPGGGCNKNASPRRHTPILRHGCSLLLIGLLVCAPAQADKLLLGVHPYLNEQELLSRFTPLAEYLQSRILNKIQVRVGQDYNSHIQAIGQDRLDIAYLGPASYVRMLQDFGAKPILGRLEANGRPSFRGHIVISDASDLQSLAQLRGRRFGFGDPNSTMSYLVPRYMLLQAGVALDDLAGFNHYSSHGNVAMAVLSGDVDAGAVKSEVFNQYRPLGLRSLRSTPEISEHLFVTRADLPDELVKRIREALLGIRDTDLVERVLRPIKSSATAIVPAKEQDYDNLRQILRHLKQE